MSYTVKELRERELKRLVSYKTSEPTSEDFDLARSLMNSFYRFSAFCERLFYLQNDEKWCNSKTVKDMEAREDKWFKRLNKAFGTYGLSVYFCGIFPSIGTKDQKTGAVSDKISLYYYK